ncbi:hypothetical protein AB2G02_25980 (plasmid) [Escherichia coli]
MTKAKEKIDNRMAYHLQQLAQSKSKEKRRRGAKKKSRLKEKKSELIKYFAWFFYL